MTDIVTVRGFVATTPSANALPSGIPVTNFRVASTPRWYDANQQIWREGATNWYTINCFRALAQHTRRSIFVGQPVIVTGRLNIKQWEAEDGRRGTTVEIDASAVGHDMNLGVSSFNRAIKPDEENHRSGEQQISLADTPESQDEQHQEASATAAASYSQNSIPDIDELQQIENHANSVDTQVVAQATRGDDAF